MEELKKRVSRPQNQTNSYSIAYKTNLKLL